MQRRAHQNVGLDNCKIVFIFYVVIWHTAHNSVLEWADPDVCSWSATSRRFILRYWRWHEKLAVPGFAFLSGLLGKGFLASNTTRCTSGTPKRWESTLSTLLVAPLLLKAARSALGCLLTVGRTGCWPEIPASFDYYDDLQTWYLFALLVWRIVTPWIGFLRFPIATSIILAVLGTHANLGFPYDMRLRCSFFLPFYVAGLYCDTQRLVSFAQTKTSRILGVVGILSTMVACQVLDAQHLEWRYRIDNWTVQSHAIVLFQYGLAGIAVVSMILLVQTIPFRLLRGSHASATLAIYNCHWWIADWIAWGTVPFATDNTKYFLDGNQSVMKNLVEHSSPATFLVLSHALAYGICSVLGSRWAWQGLRFVCEPNCSWLLEIPPSLSTTEAKGNVMIAGHDSNEYKDEVIV